MGDSNCARKMFWREIWFVWIKNLSGKFEFSGKKLGNSKTNLQDISLECFMLHLCYKKLIKPIKNSNDSTFSDFPISYLLRRCLTKRQTTWIKCQLYNLQEEEIIKMGSLGTLDECLIMYKLAEKKRICQKCSKGMRLIQ